MNAQRKLTRPSRVPTALMLALPWAALGLAACVERAPLDPAPSPTAGPTDTARPEVPLEQLPGHEGLLVPQPTAAPVPEALTRSRRRMDLDQLSAAIRQVTGGIGWTEVRGSTRVDLFEDLSATLGKPDFTTRTEEDLTPSAIFQKFLDDAARSVCAELVTADPRRDRGERTFFVAAEPTDTVGARPDAVEANLRELLVRFHGRSLAAGDPGLEPWRWLLRRLDHQGVAPDAAWTALCVALMTHPDFYTY
jgi:hypothetical protein